MTYFLLMDYNIPPKKELHSILWVRTRMKLETVWGCHFCILDLFDLLAGEQTDLKSPRDLEPQ